MLISRISPLTGKTNTLDLAVTQEQLDEFNSPTRDRLVQEIFRGLPADQREFILTGYTPEDWAAIFPPEDEEDEQ